MEGKAWWAAGTLGALVLAGLVTAGIAVTARAGDDADKDKIKKKTTITVVTPKGERGAFLGVRTSEETESDQGGARVEGVVDDSPAERAGIEEGDVIVSFDGATVRGPMALTERIHKASPDDKVQIGIVRDGKRQNVEVTLGERSHTIVVPGYRGEVLQVPLPDTEALEQHLKGLENFYVGENGARSWVFRMGSRPKLGVHLVSTTPELREHLGGGRDRGVLIGKVMSGKPAEKAGVKVGDLLVSVDGTDVSDAGELLEALEDKDGKTIRLELMRDGKSVSLDVPLPEEEDEDDITGPRAEVEEQLRKELTAARLAGLEAMRAARAAQVDAVREARQAQREAMRKARQEMRQELVRARRPVVI